VPRKSARKTAGKLPDIRAVAAVAKVSIATVSRTINGSPLVSDRLSKRVWQAIKQLNYLPTLTRVPSSPAAAVCSASLSKTSPTLLPRTDPELRRDRGGTRLRNLGELHQQRSAVLAICARRMLERKVDGVAVMTFGEEEPVLDQLVHRGVPIVLASSGLTTPRPAPFFSTTPPDFMPPFAISPILASRHRVSRRPIQSALGHHARKRLPRRHRGRRAANSEKMDYRMRSHAQGGVAGFEQLRKLATRPPPSSAPTI